MQGGHDEWEETLTRCREPHASRRGAHGGTGKVRRTALLSTSRCSVWPAYRRRFNCPAQACRGIVASRRFVQWPVGHLVPLPSLNGPSRGGGGGGCGRAEGHRLSEPEAGPEKSLSWGSDGGECAATEICKKPPGPATCTCAGPPGSPSVQSGRRPVSHFQVVTHLVAREERSNPNVERRRTAGRPMPESAAMP